MTTIIVLPNATEQQVKEFSEFMSKSKGIIVTSDNVEVYEVKDGTFFKVVRSLEEVK